ncbi:glucan endo-1,3-beta-D-glucosidase-like [Apium graveolens]|uniref:glucan endo-1,3-beta-D-glucosidase-like n=1 Tax=Apium graveolens TaxID=4045 RepID=UPI003D7B8423
MSVALHNNIAPPQPFLFPTVNSTVLPDPSTYFSPKPLKTPLPTNSFFQNFVLKNGDQHEYIHPYIIKSSLSTLSICYPSLFSNSSFFYQVFILDLTISILNNSHPNSTHLVSSYNDLSVTLDLSSSNLRFLLVRGSPFVTCQVLDKVEIFITTVHAILDFYANSVNTKYTIKLNNNQTWVLYADSPIKLSHVGSKITSSPFLGVIRIAVLSNSESEAVLDQFSSCYPVSGKSSLKKPFSIKYKWERKGRGDLLMLAHPLHVKLLKKGRRVAVLEDFKYKSIDGDLVGVVGDSWVLKTEPVSVTWHSIKGVKEESYCEIRNALRKDVGALDSNKMGTNSSYFYGKLVARAARFALIAEEVCYPEVIPAVKKFLKDTIEPWLDGTFGGNGFLYDGKWGGIVTKQGSTDTTADFGFGIYNDHHFHLGYYLYGIAVLAKIDPAWGLKYKPQAYTLMTDFMNLGKKQYSKYPRLRCFDLWKLHSWAAGLTEFPDGRNQESTSEAVNGYYAAALMGLAYGDTHLVAIGSTILAMEIQSAQTWWHVRQGDDLYPEDFTKENRVVGILWANKRDSALWFAPAESREARLGIQLLPLLPTSEVLFSDAKFARELVEWTEPVLARKGVGEGWKGFLYALEGIYDQNSALKRIKKLKGYDDGNSLSNLLWWIYSRRGKDEGSHGSFCLYNHYCH